MRFEDLLELKVTRRMLKGNYCGSAIPGDNPLKRKIDAIFFNRKEEYEVIDMIQKIVDHFKYKKMSDVHRIEKLIKDKLDDDTVYHREAVFNLLVDQLSRS